MALTLRVTSFHSQALGAESTKVFGAEGGDIGRALDNDWVLPDPEKFVSSRHAQIVCRGGTFYLKDTSTNGTFVNGSPQPVGNNVEQELHDGDRIQIADYEIAVNLDAASQQGVTGPSGPAAGMGWQPQASGTTGPTGPTGTTGPTGPGGFGAPPAAGAPENILDIFNDAAAPPAEPQAWTPPEPDHVPAIDQNFVPPAPQPAAPPQQGGEIPENWDETLFGDSGTFNQPQQIPPPAQPAMPPPAPPQPPQAQPQPQPQAQPQPQPPAAAPPVTGADQQAIVSLLMAAGLDQANAQAASTPENIAALGQILGVTAQGLIDVLTARSAVKSQFRVPMTMMRSVENNALKSSANATEALINLLVTRNTAYLGAVDSFLEGFEDVKAHQMAMMAGMRAAFDSMLERFDPEELEERFKKRKSKSMLRLTGTAQFWEMYRNLYDEMTQDADANFQRLFGEEFARAYEDQMQRLTSGRGSMRAKG